MDSATDECVICPRNTYSNTTNADSCSPCPGRTETNNGQQFILPKYLRQGVPAYTNAVRNLNN